MSNIAELTQVASPAATPSVSPSRQRWYVLFILVIAYGIHNLDKQIVSVLISPLKKEFGLTDFTVSILGGLAATIPFAIVCIPMGMVADRRNRKVLLITLLVMWSLATGMAGLATSVILLVLSRAAVGALEAGFSPISMSLISDNFRPEERSTALGIFALGAPLGTFLAMWVGSHVAADLGWRWAFFLAGVPGLVLALVIAVSIKEPIRGQFEKEVETKPEGFPFREVLRYLINDVALRNVFIGMVLCIALLACLAVWLPTFLVRVHSLDIRQAGFWSAIVVGAVGASGAAFGGYLADWYGKGKESRKLALVVATTLVSATFLLLGIFWAKSFVTAMVCIGACTLFAQTVFGTGYGLVIRLSTPQMRATVLAMLMVSFNLVSYSVGSSFAGWISDRFTPTFGQQAIGYGIALTTILSLWGLVHFFRAYIALRKRGM